MACADTDSAAPENHNNCSNESASGSDFDGDQECGSDDGFTMEPSKPYTKSAKTVDELSLAKRTGRADTVAAPTTAVSNVFQTAELLERILGKLHPFDLARAARVCNQWQGLVESSKKLQRALFLLPVQDTLAYFHPDAATSNGTGSGIWSSSPYSIKPIRVFANPLALARPDLFVPGRQQHSVPTPATFTYRTTNPTAGPSINTNTMISVNSQSSAQRAQNLVPDFFGKAWQRMLITQPPMGDVTVRWRDQSGLMNRETPTVTYDAENEIFKGVSMVQMRKLAKDMAGESVCVDAFEWMQGLGCAEELE